MKKVGCTIIRTLCQANGRNIHRYGVFPVAGLSNVHNRVTLYCTEVVGGKHQKDTMSFRVFVCQRFIDFIEHTITATTNNFN